jgi:hypothetical protein
MMLIDPVHVVDAPGTSPFAGTVTGTVGRVQVAAGLVNVSFLTREFTA